jgi:hypothetical protein
MTEYKTRLKKCLNWKTSDWELKWSWVGHVPRQNQHGIATEGSLMTIDSKIKEIEERKK